MNNNTALNTTPGIETKLRKLIDDYTTEVKSLRHYKDVFLIQYDKFIASSHNQLLNNVTVIDNETDTDFEDNFKSETDIELDEAQLNMLERTTPIIMFCFEFLSSSFVQLYLRDVTSDRSKYILLDSRLRLENRLDIFEILGVASIFKQHSDPNCFEADFDFYVRNNPAYARCDFNDPMLREILKTHANIEL